MDLRREHILINTCSVTMRSYFVTNTFKGTIQQAPSKLRMHVISAYFYLIICKLYIKPQTIPNGL